VETEAVNSRLQFLDRAHFEPLQIANPVQRAGSTESKMADWKVERAENMEWRSPVLTFVVERHGAAAMGSSRAERQQWTLNLEKNTAN
jgi:hypothetical protein